jgi:TolA-binding protein
LNARPPLAVAALLLVGCAGPAGGAHGEVAALRDELHGLRQENEALSARVEHLSAQVDLLSARAARHADAAAPRSQAGPAGPAAHADADAAAPAPAIPRDLAVVKVGPTATVPRPRAGRAAPPVPTSVPIVEPDAARVDALGRGHHRPLAAEAEAELRAARGLSGLDEAHALEDFTAHYPQHPSADNALVEAAGAYAAAGRDEAACALARRTLDEYPAGDGLSEALVRLAGCEGRHGEEDAERRLLARVVSDFPGTPAASRAEARLSQISGRGGEASPRVAPARSGP